MPEVNTKNTCGYFINAFHSKKAACGNFENTSRKCSNLFGNLTNCLCNKKMPLAILFFPLVLT